MHAGPEWDNDIKHQGRSLIDRTPTVCCFSETKKEGKSINNIVNYILNKRMSSDPEGTTPCHSQLNKGQARSGATLTTL